MNPQHTLDTALAPVQTVLNQPAISGVEAVYFAFALVWLTVTSDDTITFKRPFSEAAAEYRQRSMGIREGDT